MTYQSPLHIIKGISGDNAFEITDENLIRLRKRLLAELNLSGETTLTINKRSYSKDEIIKTIDQLLGSPDLALHDFIFKHPFLLRYLEEESMVLHPHTYSEFTIPAELQSKLNFILHERFILQFKKGISSRAFTHAQHAITLMSALPENLRSLCYEEAHQSLHTLHTFLYEMEHTLTLGNKRDIQFLGYDSFSGFLNALPEEFEGIKYDLVNRAINILVAYHKMSRHDKDLVVDMSTVLTKINCEDEQASLIRSNHKVFTSNSSSSSSSEFGYLRYIGIAAIILFNVFRVCNNNSSRDYSPSYDFSPYTNMPGTSLPTDRAFTAEHELKLYQGEIERRYKKESTQLMDFLFDTLQQPGQNPFLYGFKMSDENTIAGWKRNLEITNNTSYDLIVFICDSAKTAVVPSYIKQNESAVVSFADQNRFVFYFGNTLMRAKKVNDFGEEVPGYYEHFKHSKHISLLFTLYKISLKQPKANANTNYNLTIDSAMMEKWSNKMKFKKFNFTAVEQ